MRTVLLLCVLSMYACFTFGEVKRGDTPSGDSIPQKIQSEPYRFQPKSLILPASLITVGAVGTAIDGMQDFHLFSRRDSVRQIRVDDYLQYGMLGWVFVCDLMGNEKHHWTDQLILTAIAEGLNFGMVQGLKHTLYTPRPDGAPHSFPSGHTSTAFMGAHLAYKEFRETSPALAYSGYAIALFVGASRLRNNRHWVTDVVAGAGFGILSVELSYLIYYPLRNAIGRNANEKAAGQLTLAPMVNEKGGGVYLSFRF